MSTVAGNESVSKSPRRDMTFDEMKFALTAIAQEVNKFHNQSVSSDYQSDENNDDNIEKHIENELQIYKSKLRMKKIQIKKLNEQLKTACAIAKMVTTANEKDTAALNNSLNAYRHESVNLVKKNEETYAYTQTILREKQALHDKLNNINEVINLGYKELQKIRNESCDACEDLSAEMKLKQIIFSCGHYYAEYCNETTKCNQSEQKNRFLTNKIYILENSLPTQYSKRNLKCLKSKIDNTVKGDSMTAEVSNPIKTLRDNDFLRKHEVQCANVPKLEHLDLSAHLSLVRHLINDQDAILKDLKLLSKELSATEIPTV